MDEGYQELARKIRATTLSEKGNSSYLSTRNRNRTQKIAAAGIIEKKNYSGQLNTAVECFRRKVPLPETTYDTVESVCRRLPTYHITRKSL